MNQLQEILPHAHRITARAARACYPLVGMGNEHEADAAAVSAMRSALNDIAIDGTIVIGEGERDKAPMLYIGEKVGQGGVKIDIALDPLEGTSICAHGKGDALSVIALAEDNSLLHAPDIYMEKIAIGSKLPKDLVDLDENHKTNLTALAKAKKCQISDLKVAVLARARHKDLIEELRSLKAKVYLIDDGDVLACLKTSLQSGCLDMYLGIGGAPEGVLAAAALKSLKGQMQCRLLFANDNEAARAKSMGIHDLKRKYCIADMVKSDVIVAITWITDGFHKGIRKLKNGSFRSTSLTLSTYNITKPTTLLTTNYM